MNISTQDRTLFCSYIEICTPIHRGGAGGSYKNSDNVIAETDAEGHQKARFIPVPAFQTAEAMEELCARFLEA